MTLSANQVLNLLWSHHCDLSSPLRLTEQEVRDLELDLVAQYDDLEKSSYTDQLIHDSKESLVEFLMNNPSKSVFK